jgi:predicted NACHT family NTPase
MARSLRASVEGLTKVKSAFKLKGWSQDYLAGAVGCNRGVVIKFFAGRNLSSQFFQDICAELGLEWADIAELAEDIKPFIQDIDLDAFVLEIRDQFSTSIKKRCGTMRVLDMEQPITIDSIYTSVNILEKVSRNQRLSIDELHEEITFRKAENRGRERSQNFIENLESDLSFQSSALTFTLGLDTKINESEEGEDLDHFFTLGTVLQKRIPALEAVQKHDRLMILGKPGAGKTTFLKWLALQCIEGKISAGQVPFFVSLKEFAETEGQIDLVSFIAKQLSECGIKKSRIVANKILYEGKSFLLLDGLDEVRSQDHDRVLNIIRKTSEKFESSQFVITCRVAAKEYIFEQFTEVEVADFDDQQINDFAQKWFQLKDPIKNKEFPKELKANLRLKELATNPLLLTLLCLVFEERAGFPANRSELYKEGLDVLLKKWDIKRNIKREEVYKQLSLQRKEDLLSQIAYSAFEQSDYFLKQVFVEEKIREYICNLPNINNKTEALELDSEAVLKSIEYQHGLLVERARGIYSFSHLTFQEYFTARWFKENPSRDFANLTKHVTEKRWREVFLLTVEMLKNGDKLLLAIKQEIDGILAYDEKLQRFLNWVNQKSLSVKSHYKSAAVRVFYFSIGHDLDLAMDIREYCTSNRDVDLVNNIRHAFVCDKRRKTHHSDIDSALPGIYTVCDYNVNFGYTTNANASLLNFLEHRKYKIISEINIDIEFAEILRKGKFYPHEHEIDLSGNPELQESLKQFNFNCNVNPDLAVEQLRAALIQHRNICFDWQFSEFQQKLLQIYYDSNQFLLECLNSDCYVSREVREEIELTLLLPV